MFAARPDVQTRQRQRLAQLLDAVRLSNPFYREKLAAVAFDAASDPIERLPLTTRSEIERDQRAHPPYGSNLTFGANRYVRLHQTSGSLGAPLRWLDTAESWEWWKRCWSTVFRAANITTSDRLVFPFSFGPFVGFWSAFESATAMGCFVLPAGGMSSAARLHYLLDNRATVLCCTPTYALHLAEAAAREGLDIRASAVRAVVVAGEPGGNVASIRARIESEWGARVFDHAGMTEIGAWGFESANRPGGLLVNEFEFVAEVIDPASGQTLPRGRQGELVLTNLGRVGSPLIRYRTGDLVCLHSGEQSACAGVAQIIGSELPSPGELDSFAFCDGGVLGRRDEMIIVRGNNVFPSAVGGILAGLTGVAEYRLKFSTRESLSELRVEVERTPDACVSELADRVQNAIRDRLNFRAEVVVLEPGALPRFEMKAKRVIRV